jgi:hypothetical protein
MGLVICLRKIMILHQFYIIIVDCMKDVTVVTLSHSPGRAGMRQGEFETVKNFSLSHSPGRAGVRQGEFDRTKNLFSVYYPYQVLSHLCLFLNA